MRNATKPHLDGGLMPLVLVYYIANNIIVLRLTQWDRIKHEIKKLED